MKTLATLLSILITAASFSQSEDLVNYRIDVNTAVTQVTVIARESHVDGNNAVGRIESIHDSTINLVLNPNREYTVIINSDRFVDIDKNDIAEFNTKQLSMLQTAEVIEETEAQ